MPPRATPDHPPADERSPFFFDARIRAGVKESKDPLTVAQLVYRVNVAAESSGRRLLSAAELEQALIQCGFLAYSRAESGQIIKTPTPTGQKTGITHARYRLVGGGVSEVCLLTTAAQTYVLDHLTELLDHETGALDEPVRERPAPAGRPTPPPAPPTGTAAPAARETRGSPAGPGRAHFRFCWNCEAKVPTRFVFTCPVCGWPICPTCGACRSAAAGGCPEGKAGRARWTGLPKEKNDLRTLLVRYDVMDADLFRDLSAVASAADMDAFRSGHTEALERLQTLIDDREKRPDPARQQSREERLNARGYYRIVTVTPRHLTYVNAKGIKKTVPNRPPIRLGSEYADLSGIPKEER